MSENTAETIVNDVQADANSPNASLNPNEPSQTNNPIDENANVAIKETKPHKQPKRSQTNTKKSTKQVSPVSMKANNRSSTAPKKNQYSAPVDSAIYTFHPDIEESKKKYPAEYLKSREDQRALFYKRYSDNLLRERDANNTFRPIVDSNSRALSGSRTKPAYKELYENALIQNEKKKIYENERKAEDDAIARRKKRASSVSKKVQPVNYDQLKVLYQSRLDHLKRHPDSKESDTLPDDVENLVYQPENQKPQTKPEKTPTKKRSQSSPIGTPTIYEKNQNKTQEKVTKQLLAVNMKDPKAYKPKLYKNKDYPVSNTFEDRRSQSVYKFFKTMGYAGSKVWTKDEKGNPVCTTLTESDLQDRYADDKSPYRPELNENSLALGAELYKGHNKYIFLSRGHEVPDELPQDPEETYTPVLTTLSDRYGDTHKQRIEDSIKEHNEHMREVVSGKYQEKNSEQLKFKPFVNNPGRGNSTSRGKSLYKRAVEQEMNINEKRAKSDTNFLSEMSDPHINHSSKVLKRDSFARLTEPEPIIPMASMTPDDEVNTTFQPKLVAKCPTTLQRKVMDIQERLIKWGKDRDEKIQAEQRDHLDDEIQECYSIPKIDEHAKAIQCTPIWQRENDRIKLYEEREVQREENIKKICPFKPEIHTLDNSTQLSKADIWKELLRPKVTPSNPKVPANKPPVIKKKKEKKPKTSPTKVSDPPHTPIKPPSPHQFLPVESVKPQTEEIRQTKLPVEIVDDLYGDEDVSQLFSDSSPEHSPVKEKHISADLDNRPTEVVSDFDSDSNSNTDELQLKFLSELGDDQPKSDDEYDI